MPRYFTYILIMLIITAAAAHPAFAEDKPSLRYGWKLDLAVTSIAAAGWGVTMGAQNQIASSSCRWCAVNSFDRWGHDHIKFSDTGAANAAVYVTGYALAPLAAFGLGALAANHDGELKNNFWIDTLLIAEASAISCFTAQIVKFATARERPNAYFGGGAGSPRDNMSFYSGHTTIAFSLAVASGTVASMRGYELAPWIWGAGLTIAATTGYLSVASDRHYLTDVIAGAVAGSAFGFGIPYLFHRPKENTKHDVNISTLPVAGGGLLSLNGMW